MPTIESMQISLPSQMIAEVREAVAQGSYISSDEVLFDALQGWSLRRGSEPEEDIDGMRLALREVDEHGGPAVPMEEVMDRLHSKYRALAAASCETK